MPAATMLICFPLILLVLRGAFPSDSWRASLIAAATLWGAFLTLVTESLGATHLLTASWTLACWASLALALEALLLWNTLRHRWLLPELTSAYWRRLAPCEAVSPPALPGRAPHPTSRPGRPPWPITLLVAATALLLTLTLITALAAPPNTADTMTYHLPRVMRWIQDASLAPFPSHEIFQDTQPPWAEYALLHFHLLSGTDLLDGLPQWCAFAGCVVAASLIAAQLDAGVVGQTIAACFAATIPMAIIEASSVQNDLVVAFWLMACLAFLLAFRIGASASASAGARRASRLSQARAAVFAGLALGLATLTKSVAYVYAAPFLLVFGLWALCALRWRALLVLGALAVLTLSLNAGLFDRNLSTFGAPLGPLATAHAFSNATSSPSILAVNLTRNIAVQFGGPYQPANQALTSLTDSALLSAGLNPDDPSATLSGSPAFQVRGASGLWLSDGYTTNPVHLCLAALAAAICLASRQLRRRRALLAYLVATGGALLLFSGYLRWQAGSDRLILTLFALAAPLAGCALETLLAMPRKVNPAHASTSLAAKFSLKPATSVALLAFLTLIMLPAIPRLLYGQSRPLLGPQSVLITPRTDQYFAAAPAAEPGYIAAVATIRQTGCRQVGFLVSGPQDRAGYTTGAPAWEYPLWPLLNEPAGGPIRVEDVAVTNVTASLNESVSASTHVDGVPPCAVFAILQTEALRDWLTISGRQFHLTSQTASFYHAFIAVYLPDQNQSA